MNVINKVSDITVQDVAEYIRLDLTDETNELNSYLEVAKSFIMNYTGIPENELDDYPDFVIVVFILCQNMYDDRCLYEESDKINKVVKTILGMHSRNLL